MILGFRLQLSTLTMLCVKMRLTELGNDGLSTNDRNYFVFFFYCRPCIRFLLETTPEIA